MPTRRIAHPLGAAAVCALALLLIPIIAFAQNARPAKGRDINGTVVDVDSNPVGNATVSVAGGGPTATTAADGSFKLSGVAISNVMIDVSADGFTAKQVAVLGAATPLQLQVVIVKPVAAAPPPSETRMIGGVVSDAARAPLAGATVTVHGTQIQTLTAADGSFTLPGVALGDVTLDITAAGQPATTVTVPGDKAAVAVTIGATAEKAVAAKRKVTGRVVDPVTKEPIAAAQVQVGTTGAVVFTEPDGKFEIDNLPPGPVKLDVTAPEHENRILEVPEGTETIDIPLALSKGEQIVIEGRAPAILKTNLANGASVISDKDLNRVSAATLDQAMTAKLSGANMQVNSGAPGGGAQLRLRGISTINGQSTPLYVVDGVVVSNISVGSGANAVTGASNGGATTVNALTQDNPVNRIADLNPNDIETLEVLKGASAAALYGSKAANGVVIITTKRGRNGENHATVTQRVGMAQASNQIGARTYGSLDEVETQFCGKAAVGTPGCMSSPMVQAYMAAGGKTFNHEDELERTALSYETIGSASGGNDTGNYYGSVLIRDDPGVIKGTFYQKQTGRIAVGYKLGDRVKLGVTANLVHSLSDRGLTNNDNTNTSLYFVLSGTPNFVDLRKRADGTYPANPGVPSEANPLQTVALFQNREDVWRLIGGSTLSIDAYTSSDGQHQIKLLGNFGADSFTQKNNILSPNALLFEPVDGLPGTSVDASTTNLNWNIGTGAVWAFTPKDKGFRSVLSGGVTYESVDLNSVYVVAQNLNASQQNVDAGAAITTTENRLRTKDSGIYAQEEIALLDDQLSVLGGILGERSSLNGNPNTYHYYPKFAATYSLIKPNKGSAPTPFDMFDTLRVRGAYGEAGNRPNYGFRFTPLNATTNIDGNPGLVVAGTVGDPRIEPERQREFELGVDAATKDQRVVAEITGYQRNISNLVLQRSLATSSGFTTQYLNGGSMRNRGIEAAIQVRPVSTKQFEWTTRGVLTLNRSSITDLPSNIPTFDITAAGFGTGLGAYRIEKGKSATQIVATVDGSTAPGGVEVVGNGEPDFRVGWSNVLTFGDFTFTALLDWQHGSNIINLTRLLYDGNSNSPDVEAQAIRANAPDATPYIEDASFVKIREVSITYDLPKRLAAMLGPVKSLQVNLAGRNLATFTGYSGLDPEVSNFGAQAIGRNYDVAPYPPSRSYWLSITAGL
jgi:TonB-linked SusC/RagA family outer membrane protein